MSLSELNKIWALLPLLILFGVFSYQSAAAVELVFADQTFEFSSPEISPVTQAPLRITDLSQTTQQILFNTPRSVETPLLDQITLIKIAELMEQVNQPAINAQLAIEGSRVLEFNPGTNGQSVDVSALSQLLQRPTDVTQALPVYVYPPLVTLAETNALGITELLAIGESNFGGSPNNRVHNIRIGADKFQGLIVKPGEEFSFNHYLGGVDAANGFLPELVIKKEGLIPEFGGGLCQISSTAFRAAMNAGLPITQRRNHSFAVRYYAPQGTDATIYPGVVDLKFINDLESHLLITTEITGSKLLFKFYGTADARVVAFDGPYQYDQKDDGSMKAVWTRTVTVNGQTNEQVFRSNYLPPELFTKQEEPATLNPEITNNNDGGHDL